MVVLAVTWMANPGHEAEVAQIFMKLQEASRQEPGCLMYIVHRHRTDPRAFFIYEQYRIEAALMWVAAGCAVAAPLGPWTPFPTRARVGPTKSRRGSTPGAPPGASFT